MEPRTFAQSLARAAHKLDPELCGVVACHLRRRRRAGRESVSPIEEAF